MKQTLFAIFIGLALVVIFFWGNIVTPAVNITPTVGTNDLTDLNYPFRHFLSQSIKEGELPLWSSAISAGYPILAEGQIGGLYPLNILFSFLPTLTSINFTILFHYFLLFLFTYLYLKKIGLGSYASLFGASLTTFSGFAANELLHFGMLISYALFVGQLYFLQIFLDKRESVLAIFAMGILLGLSVLGGHPQIIFYSLLFLIPYWILFWFFDAKYPENKRSFFKFVAFAGLFGAVGLGIGAGQFLPQLEMTRNSTRAAGLSAEAISQFQFPISNLSSFISPFANYIPGNSYEAFINNGWPVDEQYVYMGILGLGFALGGFLLLKKLGARAWFFAIAAVLAMLMSFGTQFTLGYLLQVPPFSFFRLPFRFIFIVNYSLGVVAAMAFNQLFLWLGRRKLPSMAIMIIFVTLLVVSFADLRSGVKRLYPEVDAKKWYRQPEVVTFLSDKLQKQERVVSERYFFPSAKIFIEKPELWNNRNAIINLRNLLPVFNNLLYKVPMTVGAANSGGLKLGRFNDLEVEVYFRGMEYSEEGIISPTDSFMFLNRLMGVRYFLSTRPAAHFNLAEVKKITFEEEQDQVRVYELIDYYPRVFMVPQAQKLESDAIKEHLFKGDFDPLKMVFLEEDSSWGAKGGYAAAAEFEKYSDQEVVVKVEASGDGWLFLSDVFYPGWKAYVDGKEVRIYLANYAFRAVPVPEGNHSVTFRYEPESFKWGLGVTVATLAVALTASVVVIAMEIIKRRKRATS